jgi:hypothetical protein
MKISTPCRFAVLDQALILMAILVEAMGVLERSQVKEVLEALVVLGTLEVKMEIGQRTRMVRKRRKRRSRVSGMYLSLRTMGLSL